MFRARGLRRSVGGRLLFDHLELSVHPAEHLVVRGASGSGKTLLLRMLCGLDTPGSAQLELLGRSPDQWGWPEWRARVLLVPQLPPVLPGTPHDLLESVGLVAVQRLRPHDDPVALATGWNLPPDAWMRPWTRLSGGERQRALLALAVSRRPDVLLLDEPTSALDPDATAAVERSLQGQAAVWVSHDAGQIERVASRVVTL